MSTLSSAPPRPLPGADAPSRPAILLGQEDHRRAQALAMDALLWSPRRAAPLLAELDRAAVLPDDQVPEGTAGVGSHVEYSDSLTGRIHRARLVAREVVDETAGDLSILSAAGTALLGLSVGQAITWRDGFGAVRVFELLSATREGSAES